MTASCARDAQGFEFENFQNTPIWALAKAVKENDVESIRKFAKQEKINIDYKEPKYNQTLLALAIVNQKKEAFVELLKADANPNILLGSTMDSSPLTEAIIHQSNCDLFYIETLLRFGADPNLKIAPKSVGYFSNGYPLLTACSHNITESGSNCLDAIKLLVRYGADINCCNPVPENKGLCEGVLYFCLSSQNMEALRYFVVDQKIKIPDVVYITGSIDFASREKYSLSEILNTEDFEFEDFQDELGQHTFTNDRKNKNEIVLYLKRTGQH